MAVDCTVPSIYLDISEQLLQSSNYSHQYGLYVGLGAPSQNGSLWPSITQNETVFRTENFCASDSSTQCSDNLHKELLMSNISTTWKENTTYQSLDDASLYSDVSLHYGRDTLNLWTQSQDDKNSSAASLSGFPVTLVSNYTSAAAPNFGLGRSLGLGSASTVLDHLYKQKLIASKSYGLYLGTKSTATKTSGAGNFQNGSLVLGGYDVTRSTGPVHTYSQSPILANRAFSPFKVRVAQMSLDSVSGRSVKLTKDGGFDAYLTTNQYPLRLPRSVTQTIADSLSATPGNNTDNTLRIPTGFEGNITFTLGDGLVVTFDSAWLSNNLHDSPISATPIQNSTFSTSNSTGFASRPADVPNLLGVAFLQQLYLVVSYDTTPTTFSLAQANHGPRRFQHSPSCSTTAPPPAIPSTIDTSGKRGLVGAVLGGVIGGIAFVLLLAFFLRRILRKRMIVKRNQSHMAEIKPRSRWDDLKTRLKSIHRIKSFDVEAKQTTAGSDTCGRLSATRFGASNATDSVASFAQTAQHPPPSNPKLNLHRSDAGDLHSSSTNTSLSGTSSVTEIENVEMTSTQMKSGRLVSLDFGFNERVVHHSLRPNQVGWDLSNNQCRSYAQDDHSGWASSATRRSLDGASCSKSSIISSCHSSEDRLWRNDSIARSQISGRKLDWRSSSIYSRE